MAKALTLPRSRKLINELQSNIDSARRACDRANNLVCVILEETKRPPYMTAEEIESVFEDCDSANQDIEEALRLLLNSGGK